MGSQPNDIPIRTTSRRSWGHDVLQKRKMAVPKNASHPNRNLLWIGGLSAGLKLSSTSPDLWTQSAESSLVIWFSEWAPLPMKNTYESCCLGLNAWKKKVWNNFNEVDSWIKRCITWSVNCGFYRDKWLEYGDEDFCFTQLSVISSNLQLRYMNDNVKMNTGYTDMNVAASWPVLASWVKTCMWHILEKVQMYNAGHCVSRLCMLQHRVEVGLSQYEQRQNCYNITIYCSITYGQTWCAVQALL